MLKLFGFGTFNDRLALCLAVIIIPGLWVVHGLGKVTLPGEVLGATIAIETLIAQYYWRKAPTNGTPGTGG